MYFRLHIKNFRVLRQVDWSPEGVCALVGPNGSGKTTLLHVPAMLGDAAMHGMPWALEAHGGLDTSSAFSASDGEPLVFSLTLGALHWQATMPPRAAQSVAIDALAPPIAELLTRYRVLGPHDACDVRRRGSADSTERRLDRLGSNVFSVLLNWHEQSADRERFEFVLDGLREMYTGFFEALYLTRRAGLVRGDIRARGSDTALPVERAPRGWFLALRSLIAVGSAEPGDVVALDDPEVGLHPHAVKALIGRIRAWSRLHRVTVLLATHSPTLLDCFRDCPENVFVMEPGREVLPVALSTLREPTWLRHLAFGELYVQGEFGAPPSR